MRSRHCLPPVAALAFALLATPLAAQVPDDEPGRTAAPPAYALDAGRLRAMYLDLLGRPPFASEREEWLGRGAREWLDVHLGGEDYWENWLEEQLYYFLLIDNFRPRTERVRALPADLAAGRVGVQTAIHRAVLSPSFDRRNPGADTFVTVVMEQLLSIRVQDNVRELEIGKKIYEGGKGLFLGRHGTSQSDVVKIAIEDDRFLRRYLEREHERLLRVPAGKRDVKTWAKRLSKRPNEFPQLVRSWVLSPAYDARLATRHQQPNHMFVRSLWVDLTDALPDDDETRRIRGALDGLADAGPLRSVLARLLVDSGRVALPAKASIEDPTKWVGGLFERLLGRAGTQDELAAFVGAFHDPACKPSTVLYALVSHPEYHVW